MSKLSKGVGTFFTEKWLIPEINIVCIYQVGYLGLPADSYLFEPYYDGLTVKLIADCQLGVESKVSY